MRLSIHIRPAVTTAAAIALLFGYSAAASQAASARPGSVASGGSGIVSAQATASSKVPDAKPITERPATSWMRQSDARTPLVYVSDSDGVVVAFRPGGVVVGHLALSSPEGLFVDSGHNLWIANGDAAQILEFARGSTSPRKTLNDPNGNPGDVTVCPNGTVYVSNQANYQRAIGDIRVYASGSTSPTGRLTYPGEAHSFFLTCDTAGNVFSTIQTRSGGAVVEYPGGRQSEVRLLPIRVSSFPAGIKQDNAGNLLVADALTFTVTEYTEAGLPTGNSIRTPNSYTSPEGIAVSRNGKAVGIALFDVRLGGDAEGEAYSFPGGVPLQAYGNFYKPIGIAFDPGQAGI